METMEQYLNGITEKLIAMRDDAKKRFAEVSIEDPEWDVLCQVTKDLRKAVEEMEHTRSLCENGEV